MLKIECFLNILAIGKGILKAFAIKAEISLAKLYHIIKN